MSEAAPAVTHAVHYEAPGAQYRRIVCACGEQSDAEKSNRGGANKLARWVLKHQVASGGIDLSKLAE